MRIECYICQREVPEGEPYLSVDYHIERVENDGKITVDVAESLLSACIDCSPSREAIAGALRAHGYPIPPSPDEHRT